MDNEATQGTPVVNELETAATERISDLAEAVTTLRAELEAARAAEQSSASTAEELREQLDAANLKVRDAASKYREARLAASPDVPPELVPESDDIADIERSVEAALRLASHVRERVQQESQATVRVPAGAPVRRARDVSGMSAAEKIRVGLEQLSDGN